MMVRLLPYVGAWAIITSASSALLFWLWLGVRDDLAAEIERCNTDKEAAVAAAEEVTRIRLQEAFQERLRELEAQVRREARAREIAADAASQAESRANRAMNEAAVRIREIERNANASLPEKCAITVVPDDLRSVYD
jgi:hypothetical protein